MMPDRARLITEDRVVTVLCLNPRNPNETLIKDAHETWWERNANLTPTGVRHQAATVEQLHRAEVEPPCDTEGPG